MQEFSAARRASQREYGTPAQIRIITTNEQKKKPNQESYQVMTSRNLHSKFSRQAFRSAIAILCVASLAPCPQVALGQAPPEPVTTPVITNEAPKIPNDQLDSLVAPIALYPDPLLSQTLVASTYPLELIQLQQWMERNKTLKGQALADAVKKQPWDASIQGMVAFPDVVERAAGNIQWTTELGNAFLAQQEDVMLAVQRMRAKAQGTGSLKTSAEQTVETKTVENKEVIIIQQADPKVIYVPSYDPVVVYGAPVYPYPTYVYPGYVAGRALAFGAGVALGAAWGGGWGYNCGWGRGGNNTVVVNRNNTFVNNSSRNTNVNANRTNISGGNKVNIGNRVGGGNNSWQHNPQHRGGAPYGDRGTANKFGGRAPGQKPGGGIGGIGGSGNKPGGGAGIGGGGAAGRPSTLPASRPSGGSNIGNRSVTPGASSGAGKSAFSGAHNSGGAAKANSARGASSMKSAGASRAGAAPARGGGGAARGGKRR
jgi:hypothetical protein